MEQSKSIHQFSVKDVRGKEISLADYEGKVLLIVNTASQCGFTPQLEAMETLYKEFRNEGFEILAFPSNDFAGQEPLEGEALEQFCVLNYEASYPIFDKIHVKGSHAHPVFRFLSKKDQNGKFNASPKWNFQKYLIDKEGKVVDFYFSITSPTAEKVKQKIKDLLQK